MVLVDADQTRMGTEEIMRAFIRPMLHAMKCKNGRPIEFWRGDDAWAPSLHLNWKWRGQWYWLCVFFG